MTRSTSNIADVHVLYLASKATRTGTVAPQGVRCSCREWTTLESDPAAVHELWRQHLAEVQQP